MDENLKKLYESLSSRGYYTKSFDDFQQQYQDQSYQDKVFDVVQRDGLYTQDKQSFLAKYSPLGSTEVQTEELKKKDQLDSTELPLEEPPLVSSSKPTEEKDYFEGAFGDVLRGFDNVVPLGIGDFVDDMARSVATGYRQGKSAEAADNLLLAGAKATPEEVEKFIEANKSASQLGQSKEMQDYMKTYEEEGKGFWGVVKGLFKNPTLIPEVLTSSLTSLATNTDALKAGATAVGAGTVYGAVAGAPAGGVGAAPGALAGAAASIPYAFGLASSVVEAGSTFGELLQEQLREKEMTKENVKQILENPDKLQEIRNKAIARGIVIGAADAFTGKLASGVGAKILSKSAAKSATGAATKGAVTKATAAGAGIESVGGSLGEAAARGAIGQEMDVSEIALEGLAELPGGVRSTIQARLAKPEYKVNGAKATKEDVDDLINTMSPAELSKTKIEIKNDYEGRQYKIDDKILTGSIKEQVRQGNPELNEPSLNAITELEKELKKIEGNTTQTGKDKAAAIRSQIKDIQENQLQEENAIQKPTTEESVLRTEQPEVGLPKMGEGDTKGEATQEGITPAKPKEVEFSNEELESLKADIGKIEEQGTLSENLEGKVYRGNEEGNIKIEGQQYVFESNNTIKELGNVNEVGDSFLASFGLSQFPTEGVKAEKMAEGKKPNIVTIEGKEFTFLRSRKPEGGKAVIVVKDNETGLQRVIKGDGAEKALKDISLQKSAPEIKLELKTEGKPVVEKTEQEIKQEAKAKRREERINEKAAFEAKTLEELTKMQEQLDKEAAKFESDLLDTIAQESGKEKRIVVKSKGQEFAVTKKADGEYAVSQKNENGRFIGIKDTKTRNRVVKLFEKAKTKKDEARVKQAEELSTEFKKEQSDKILSALDKAIAATSTKGKAYDATLGLPLMVTNTVLKIVRAAYKGGKSLAEAIKDGHNFLKKEGYLNISEYDLKKYVADKLGKSAEVKPNEALKDIESTAKALEGKDISMLEKLSNIFMHGNMGESFREGKWKKYGQLEKLQNFGDGIHLGTFEQAKEFLNNDGKDGYIYKVKLNAKNIKEGKDQEVLINKKVKELVDKGIPHKEAVEKALKDNSISYSGQIENAEALKYKNTVEGSDKDFSYVVFNPDLTKIISVVKFDKGEKSVIYDNSLSEISEAYHKAKADGSNPELVKAVEDLLGKKEAKSEVDELLNLDTKDKTNLEKVFDFLDNADKDLSKRLRGGANEGLLAIPLGAAQVIVKAVKVLVKGGMTLQEAITKAAKDNNVSFDDVVKMMKAVVEKPTEVKSQPKSTTEYEKITKAVDADVTKGKTSDEILSRIQKTDAYKKLTDTEKENITRYVKESFGEKTKKAPSAGKLLGFLKDVKKITATEMSLLKKQFKDMAKGAKGAETAIKKATAEIGAELKKMREGGKISAKQVDVILSKFSKLKVLNSESVTKFTDYMRKVFADADYTEKLKNANDLKKSIKKASKGNNYDPHLVKLAKRFLRIDPSLVEDLNEYNKMASDLKEAIKGSSTKKFASTVEIKTADAYVEEMMKTQKEKLTEMMREEIEDLLGVDGSKFTYDEMMKLIQEEKVKGAEEKQKLSEQNEKAIRSAAIKLFDSLSSSIDYILETGKDPFTGEDVDIKQSKKDVVKRFMEMDLTKMDIKDAIRAVDALNNFIVNESTAKMEDTVRKYEGNRKAEALYDLGIKAKRLKIYFSKSLGRFLTDQFATQPILFEALFGGTKIAEYVEREMGIADLKSNKSKAQAMVNKMVSDYVVRFEKTNPNGEAFNTSSNSVERGMLAFVSRAEIGNEQKSFNNRKKLVEDSIKELKSGTEEQQKKGEVYEKVYDKILKDSKNAQEVKNKADKKNAEAVDYWVEKWTENYDELADVAENIHNTILGKDFYYTPDKYSSLGPERGLKVEQESDFDIMGSAFLQNSGNIYKTKTGRLEEALTEDKLPKNRYVDLSFDSNNANLMMDAMIDVKTAGDVRQIDAFLKSDAFNQIVPNAEERKILQSRIDLMVRNFRNKTHYNYDEIAKLSKSLNRIASLGASYALSSVFQPLKQVIPVAVNTMANGGIPKFRVLYDKAMRDFVDNSGEAIALRGMESVSEFKAIESLIEKAAESTPEKAMQIIEKINRKYLELFLQKPDAYIAKASWMAYYEKALKKQGKDVSEIDYSKHEINREAAQYAQKMVDRQQNISDADLKGRVFSDKSGLSQITTKVILPFASFRINQWLRMNADLGTITSKTATKEDREAAVRSLGGFGLEVATFNAIGLGISGLTYSLATGLLRDATGSDDNEDDKKKLQEKDEKYWKNLMKGKGGSVIQDVFSPVPFADPLFEGAAYASLNAIQALSDVKEEDRINIFSPKPKEFFKGLGTLGIVSERTYNLYNITKALATGKIEEENFGKTTTKNIRNRDEDVLAPLATLAFLNTLGVLPADFNTAQNTIFKEITKQASTKTESEVSEDREKKKEQNEKYTTKIKELDEAISKTRDEKVIDELLQMKKETQDKINKPEVSTEEKENAKEEKEKEKAEYKELLEGYENRSELKKYNPRLYEENFGEYSDYYKAHKSEMEAEKLYNEAKKENKDELYDYTPKKKKARNRDGTTKRVARKSFRVSSRSSSR